MRLRIQLVDRATTGVSLLPKHLMRNVGNKPELAILKICCPAANNRQKLATNKLGNDSIEAADIDSCSALANPGLNRSRVELTLAVATTSGPGP